MAPVKRTFSESVDGLNVLPVNVFSEDIDSSDSDNIADELNALPIDFFSEEFLLSENDDLLSETSQIFLENPLPDDISEHDQFGAGLNDNNNNAASSTDYWTPLETEGPSDLNSAIVLVEKSRRPNGRYQAEEITYQVLVDPDRLPAYARGATLKTVIEVVRSLFEVLIRRATALLEPQDLIRLCIIHETLDRPISTTLMPVSSFTVEIIMSAVMRVLQSKDKIRLDEGFTVDVITVRRPKGAGRNRRLIIPSVDRLKKRSVTTVPKDEMGLCCAKAILLAIAALEKDPELRTLQKKDCSLLLRRALKLHADADVPEGPCGFEEIGVFERYLNVQVVVITTADGNQVGYKGCNRDRRIYLYLQDNHYDVITSPKGFYGSKQYCEECNKPFDHVENHYCTALCNICRRPDCQKAESIRCSDCDRDCQSSTCYDAHKERGICDKIYQCQKCCRVLRKRDCPKEDHRCGEMKCPSCKQFVSDAHRCFLRREAAKPPSDKLLFFDFETDQSTGEHLVNFAVAHYADGGEHIFDGYEALDKFCKFLFSPQHKGYTAIAHNMKGFDGQFILRWMLQQGQTPEMIPNGSKIMLLRLHALRIKVIDSFNFLPMALSKLPKTFGIEELEKGFFPHLFNTQENQDYVGELPAQKFYSPETMSAADRTKFLRWYDGRKSQPFDFKKEMLAYCRSDVDILRRCCVEFRDQFLGVTSVDPFSYVTIASACMATYRHRHIQQNTIAMVPSRGYVNRTNYSRDSIRWLDYVSKCEGLEIRHALNGTGEIKIAGYHVDGFCCENNTVYQYQGCIYHGCSTCYDSDLINPTNGLKMGVLRQKTDHTSATIRRAGYDFVEIWEHQFRKQMKSDENLKEFLSTHEVQDRLNPRDAFYGGRTNAVNLYFEGQAKYIDFTSLYPWVNKYCSYPVGHPVVITEGFDEIDAYFGIIKCTVLPPKRLYHPVLPYRCRGKLMFPLCRLCTENCQQTECQHNENERTITGTWVTEEVKKAKQKGYVIIKIHEVYHFPSTSSTLFQSYIDTFLKIKQEASGWPSDCQTDEDRTRYIQKYAEKEGIHLDSSQISHNPGRRSVAKLALNSFWGRWGMICNKTQLTFVNSVSRFNKIFTDKSKNVKDIYLPTPEVAAIQWCQKEEFEQQDAATNIFLAAFTTCHARLKLYSELEKLDRSVLYFDTDSIIYKTDGLNDPPLGCFLGEFTDELNGDTITSFVSGGPKNYAFTTSKGSTICKIRGFSLNFQNSLLLNFLSVKDLVCSFDDQATIETYNSAKISRDAKTRRVLNKEEKKIYRMVYDKRVMHSDFSTTPYGY